eukprot:TRINITY_DN3271_c2_g1_i2.p2 TRINITY_DN3271_c2_g1~~TRINITY_DN3271_c2_g1_i2.p2  ORF type:complete len:120 (-),score=2.18 TRINITY_DN3271_c2_g1_i2:447-806(-)
MKAIPRRGEFGGLTVNPLKKKCRECQPKEISWGLVFFKVLSTQETKKILRVFRAKYSVSLLTIMILVQFDLLKICVVQFLPQNKMLCKTYLIFSRNVLRQFIIPISKNLIRSYNFKFAS